MLPVSRYLFSNIFNIFKYSFINCIMPLLLTTPTSLALSATDFFASDLCTVHSTNTKTCNNDWISKPGTCYEDTCCTSFETATSWYYRLAQGSHVIFSLLGLLVIIIYASKYSSKHMLPDNVRVLVNIMLILMFAHSIDMILIHVSLLFIYCSLLPSSHNRWVMETSPWSLEMGNTIFKHLTSLRVVFVSF